MADFEIYAEISKKMLAGKEFEKITLPNGVRLNRFKNARSLTFYCDDIDSKNNLIDILDAYGISWQDNSDA